MLKEKLFKNEAIIERTESLPVNLNTKIGLIKYEIILKKNKEDYSKIKTTLVLNPTANCQLCCFSNITACIYSLNSEDLIKLFKDYKDRNILMLDISQEAKKQLFLKINKNSVISTCDYTNLTKRKMSIILINKQLLKNETSE